MACVTRSQDVAEKVPEFYARLYEIRWGLLVKPCKANENWLREFYANIPTEDMDKEKKKRRSWDKLFICMWKGVKRILKALSPSSKMPPVSKEDAPQYSFLNGFEDEDSGDGGDEASS
ncbi:hypothetical protein HAX54_028281 [Datura stramonium]|uniref:Uncharacterized protein n=1 Tax=Datura stramonium TaxID=4076 RepID=A0ABS8V5Y5_DATST|nr:hypothetical protein [Datura stramonium]